jgi:hypothetical protein
MKQTRTGVWLIVLALTIGAKLNAAVIYNNTTSRVTDGVGNPVIYFPTTEVGDEILLTTTDPSRYLQTFSFEFYGTNTASPLTWSGANVTMRVRMYLNNGPDFNGYATPGTNIFDSGAFSIAAPPPTGVATLNFAAGTDFPVGGLFLGPGPGGSVLSNMTFSVQFSGLGATDQLGLPLYSPPTVGGNYSDFWENNGGWVLQTNVFTVSFGANMSAVTPEPSPVALSILGGLGLLLARRWLWRKS